MIQDLLHFQPPWLVESKLEVLQEGRAAPHQNGVTQLWGNAAGQAGQSAPGTRLSGTPTED